MVSGLSGASGFSGCSGSCSSGGITQAFFANFIARFNKVEDDETKDLKSLLKEADSDGDGELSKDELNSIDVSNDDDKADLVKELNQRFNSLDKDGNGSLSLDEMKEMLKEKQYSIQELSEMQKAHEKAELSQGSDDLLGALPTNSVKEILSKYKSANIFEEFNSTISMGI